MDPIEERHSLEDILSAQTEEDPQEDCLSPETAPIAYYRTLFSEESLYKRRFFPLIDMPEYLMEIRISTSNLQAEQLDFIASTFLGIAEALRCKIFFYPNNVYACTHLITSTNEEMLCPRTYMYIEALLNRKSIVSFFWYLELFDISKKTLGNLQISRQFFAKNKLITEKHLVKGDIISGPTQSPLYAHSSTNSKGLFRNVCFNDLNSTLSKREREMIECNEGILASRKGKKKQIKIRNRKDFYDLIAKGTHLLSSGFSKKPESNSEESNEKIDAFYNFI
ncbi:hypothetical protein NEFER03_1683 [Nematocida sp. LUAm3]|nr:hypothetical protein NEFER03_1683 [Nematocida sp. LUAm3]KAI5175673.1 hypothetical protein NEFER02_1560 [Nematocida sp. LUAm2]KAI5178579.1 hypothetical protein NEFER01_1715 [Nematocida sp. LUAm1]